MLEKIKLVVRGGDLVAFEYVTPLNKPAEMVVWGERFFTLTKVRPARRYDDPCEDVTTYTEGLAFVIPSPGFYAHAVGLTIPD